jgi:hypothetical protein
MARAHVGQLWWDGGRWTVDVRVVMATDGVDEENKPPIVVVVDSGEFHTHK